MGSVRGSDHPILTSWWRQYVVLTSRNRLSVASLCVSPKSGRPVTPHAGRVEALALFPKTVGKTGPPVLLSHSLRTVSDVNPLLTDFGCIPRVAERLFCGRFINGQVASSFNPPRPPVLGLLERLVAVLHRQTGHRCLPIRSRHFRSPSPCVQHRPSACSCGRGFGAPCDVIETHNTPCQSEV